MSTGWLPSKSWVGRYCRAKSSITKMVLKLIIIRTIWKLPNQFHIIKLNTEKTVLIGGCQGKEILILNVNVAVVNNFKNTIHQGANGTIFTDIAEKAGENLRNPMWPG